MKPKNIFLNIAVHIGIIALISYVHLMTSCLPYNDPIMMICFYIFSLLGIVIHPSLFNNKTAEKYLWYLLCYTSFVMPYIHIDSYYKGLLGFITIICTMLLMNLLVSHNASIKYFPNIEHINLMVSRNVKYICYIGGLSEISFLLYSQFFPLSKELALLYGIMELSIIVLWSVYTIVYLYPKHVILIIPFIILLTDLVSNYYVLLSDLKVNSGLFTVLQYIIAVFLIFFAINGYCKLIKLSKDKWLLVTIILSIIMLCGINLYLYVEGFFPVNFMALQLASYAVGAFLLIKDYSKQCKLDLNMEALIASGLYAVFFIFEIIPAEIALGPGTEVQRHIQWSGMFVVFTFIVVILSNLRFKKYNSLKCAICVFLGGTALNVCLVYHNDLANYATWLPQLLQKHLVMAICYGAGHFIINMLLQKRQVSPTPNPLLEVEEC